MKAWIIYYREGALYNQAYIRFYQEEGRKLGIEVELILVEEIEFGVKNNRWFLLVQGVEREKPDFVIVRAIYPLLSKQLEAMGVMLFNNSFVSEICNDKAKTYQYLASTGILMVDSHFYKSGQVKEQLDRGESYKVIKSVDGHGGKQVFLVSPHSPEDDNRKEARLRISQQRSEIIDGLGNSDVVIQPLIGSKHQDLRVYIIGNEIIASVLRTAKEGFKSNFSLGGEVSLYQLSKKEEQIVHQIIEQFDFGLVGIDFILDDEGALLFNEIEDVVGSRMLYQCAPEINIVKRYLTYILQKIKIG